MAFRIAKDRLTEDIIVALGSGIFILLISPLLLKLLGLQIQTAGAVVQDDSALKRIEEKLDRMYDEIIE